MTAPFDMPPLFALLFGGGTDGRTHEVGALLHAAEHATSEADVMAALRTFIGAEAASVLTDAEGADARAHDDHLLHALDHTTSEAGDVAGPPTFVGAEVASVPTGAARGNAPPELEVVLRACERATNAEEAIAIVSAFVDQAVLASSNPVETLARVLGAECASVVAEVAVAAIANLEAATAGTAAPVSDGAAVRISRKMVRRVIRRAERTEMRPPRACVERRVRVVRTARAHRAPRRRAVRLSAVTSAGDGPSPPERPPAVRGGSERPLLGRLPRRLAIDLADDVLPASEVPR
jgi:hypothetical protein